MKELTPGVAPPQDYLRPLEGDPTSRPFVVYDVESKHADTEEPGFTSPFLAGVHVGPDLLPGASSLGHFEKWRDMEHLNDQPWDGRWLRPGGCIDLLMRYLLEDLPEEVEQAGARGEDGEVVGFKGMIVYAHNGGSFDHLHVLPWLEAHVDHYEFKVIPVASSIQEMQVKRRGDKKALWYFRDSMKLLPMGLEKACKAMGVAGKLDHSLAMPKADPRWEAYLRQDCKALYDAMTRHRTIVHELGGNVGMTTPATSMNIFRRAYLKRKIPRHAHLDECLGIQAPPPGVPAGFEPAEPRACRGCFHQWVRQAYYGGRTELFGLHGRGLRYYDVNSSYAASLCKPMPVGERYVTRGEIDWRMTEGWVGFAECEVEIPVGCEIPPLPHRHGGKLKFPVGRFKGTWDVAELKLLYHPRVRGKILDVGRVAWIRAEAVTREMVHKLFEYRDKSRADYDEGRSQMAKLTVNGFYGKLGQRQERMEIVRAGEIEPGVCFLCQKRVREDRALCRSCQGSKPAGVGEAGIEAGWWYRGKLVDPSYVIPQFAAHVTAESRILLFNGCMTALDLGGRVYMTDTDSIITDVDMPTSNVLGAFKDEYPGKLLNYFAIQPKVYVLEFEDGSVFSGSHLPICKGDARRACPGCAPWKVAMKGFQADQHTADNVRKLQRDLERIQRGEQLGDEEMISYSRLEKVRSMARGGFRMPPRMVDVSRSFKSPYDKRVVVQDGSGRTNPVELREMIEAELAAAIAGSVE